MKRLDLCATTALMVLSVPAHALASGGGPEAAAAHHGAPHINWFTFYPTDGSGPPLAIALLNFAVLLFLLVKLFGKSFTSYLQNRHDSIKHALEEGARLRAEAQQRLDEYGRKIANVDKEVDALVATIRASAEQEKARILAEAQAQAAALKREAEDRIAGELARARESLEREVVFAAIAAAEQLLRDKARPDDQTRLADDFIAQLDKPAPSSAPSGGSVDDSW